MSNSNNGNIFIQDGRYINVLHPEYVAKAPIYTEEQRDQIKRLIKHNFLPHHSAVGIGKCTRKHWNTEKYRGKYGSGFKLITAYPFSSRFNTITYFLKIV